jgi:hypothetical protein
VNLFNILIASSINSYICPSTGGGSRSMLFSNYVAITFRYWVVGKHLSRLKLNDRTVIKEIHSGSEYSCIRIESIAAKPATGAQDENASRINFEKLEPKDLQNVRGLLRK